MKKLIFGSSLILMMMVLFTACKDNDDDIVIGLDQLPVSAKTYISVNFSAQSITKVEQEMEGNTLTGYDVTLKNGVKLEFNAEGQIEQIESNSKLPDIVIPVKILTYVNANYTSTFITEWEKRATEQEVGLSNGVDLVFDLEGNFKRIDN